MKPPVFFLSRTSLFNFLPGLSSLFDALQYLTVTLLVFCPSFSRANFVVVATAFVLTNFKFKFLL